jgi:hypothetical protein
MSKIISVDLLNFNKDYFYFTDWKNGLLPPCSVISIIIFMKNTVSVVLVLILLLHSASARFGVATASLNTQSAYSSLWYQYGERFVFIRAQQARPTVTGLLKDPNALLSIADAYTVNSDQTQ